MNEKKVELGNDAREKVAKGITLMCDAVKCTLGPLGRNVIIKRNIMAPAHITKDGVTVAKDIILRDASEDLGVQIVREAAMKTAEKAGDGTTTATIIASSIIVNGISLIKNGSNPVRLKRGIELAAGMAVKYVAENSRKIKEGTEQLRDIATISANNDPEIGTLVAEGMSKVSADGTIAVETSKTGETTISVVEGMKFDSGYVSPYFMTDTEKMQAVMEEPYILCADTGFSNMAELVPILEHVMKANGSIVIIANEIEGDALSALILNKVKGLLKVVAVKTPSYGELRKENIKDIAAVCGGVVHSPEIGNTAAEIKLGRASKVIVTKDSTTIIGGAGNAAEINLRIIQVRSQVESSKYEQEKKSHEARLARLSGGVAVMYVGAATEIEMKEKKDQVDDALCATKAALEEGIIPGGGICYLNASEMIRDYLRDNYLDLNDDLRNGMMLVIKALSMPFKTIMENAGISHEVVLSKIREKNENEYGYDAKNENYGNMFELGIIDPAKVARVAIESSSSVACTFITTECAITPEPIVLPQR